MTDKPLPTVSKAPCASCPYRCDVASGIWDESEYDKLRKYDGETWQQIDATGLFKCHQDNGNLCSGWVACHNPGELLALRLHRVAPEVFDYESPVPVFKSGAEAADHGMRDYHAPGAEADRMRRSIARKRGI